MPDKFALGSTILDAVMVGIFLLYLPLTIVMSISNPNFLILIIGIIIAIPVGIFLSLPCVIVAWFYFNSLIQKEVWSEWRWVLGGALIAFVYILVLTLYFPQVDILGFIAFFGLPTGAYVGFHTLKKAKIFKERNSRQASDLVGGIDVS